MIAMAAACCVSGEVFSCCMGKQNENHDIVEHMDERKPHTRPEIQDIQEPSDDGKPTIPPESPQGSLPPGQDRMSPRSNHSAGMFSGTEPGSPSSSRGRGADTQQGGCCMCCALTDEKLTDPGYDEQKALDNVWWCCYCCCAGWGGSRLSTRPYIDAKCCFYNQQCKQVRCKTKEEGLCSVFQSCCCCMYVCQLPRREMAPDIMICNWNPCQPTSMRRRSSTGDTDYDNGHDSALEQFVCCYTCCLGCACAPALLACVRTRMKCCCCNVASGGSCPTCQEESIRYGWCGHYLACWKCYSQCKAPLYYWEVPVFACCGRRCRKPSSDYDWR